jgi:hypothetical protein
VKSVAGNEELEQVAADDIWPDHDQLAVAVVAKQQHLDRIAEIIVVEPVVLDAVKLHRRVWRHHEIVGRT